MDLGVRQIRTAGKGSGSIELTLPPDLRDLVGLPCRIILRDGDQPDIVLQPDLKCAHQTFLQIWQTMAAVLLRDAADVSALPLTAFVFGLHPRTRGGEQPYLCWRDGLALGAAAPHDPDAVSRTLAAFGQAMADRLNIDPALAFAFGAACGYLVAGVPPTQDGQEACEVAAVALHVMYQDTGLAGAATAFVPAISVAACAAGIMDGAFWRHATPILTAAADLFTQWTADPSGHPALRAAWRRGRALGSGGD